MIVQLRKISGNWDKGFALHKHVLKSTYLGENENGRPLFDTLRSDPGEALFQLKYRDDFSQAKPLATALYDHIIPKLGKFGLIIPMAASNVRKRQPVNEVCQHLAELTGKPLFEDLLVKNSKGGSAQLKDLATKDEKAAALQGRFAIKDEISNEGQWNALLVDDLFDTGASLEAACDALRTYGKIDRIFVAAITWK